MDNEVIKAYQKEIARLRTYSTTLENQLWSIYDSKAWKAIMFIRNKLLGHQHSSVETNSTPAKLPIDNDLSSNKYPPVSIIIPCHNYGSYLLDAIDSARSQTYPHVEIIVVDDGSTDEYTKEVLKTLSEIKIIHQEKNGPSAARNNGIKESKGAYICCLDADDKLAPTYVEKIVEAMEREGVDICGSYQKFFGDIYADIHPKNLTPDINSIIHNNPFSAGAMFTKKIWEKTGGYKTFLNSLGTEDWEFWLSAFEAGAKGRIVPKYLFYYRKHGSTLVNQAIENKSTILPYIKNLHPKLFPKT